MFENKNLSVLAYANCFTMWNYQSEDKIEDILSVKYFNNVADLMNKGDIIFINIPDGAFIRYIVEKKDRDIIWGTVK